MKHLRSFNIAAGKHQEREVKGHADPNKDFCAQLQRGQISYISDTCLNEK